MKTPTCLRIVMIAMDLFFLLIGLALFVGGIWLFNDFPLSKRLLAPPIAAEQSVITVLSVAGVGALMSLGSVFGGYGTIANRNLWVICSSSLLTPCFATLCSIGVCILVYQTTVYEMIKTTMQYEAARNLTSGLLRTGSRKYDCCGISDLINGCDRTYPPYLACPYGSERCQKGCLNAVWNNMFVPYMNGTISALFTISAVLLAGIIVGIFVYRAIAEENRQQRQQQAVATHNRAIKEE